jgi:outer membrane protein TolC
MKNEQASRPLQSMAPLCLCAMLMLLFRAPIQAQSTTTNGVIDLTLDNLLTQVLEHNESIQSKLLEMEVSRRRASAEYGIFEPELFGSAEHVVNNRENTAEQESSQLSQQYSERNNVYQGGIEGLGPSGLRVRLGYSLRDLNNSLQGEPILFFGPRGGTNGEFQSFFGINLTQPLLKNRGHGATLAGIRIAALGSDIAYHEYRRQLMITLGTAEAHYWNLFLAQEQVRYFRDSVSTAEKILHDNRQRFEAGRSSELEVLEAEAGVALRKARLSDAEQKLYEAAARVLSLYSQTVLTTNRLIRAADQPQLQTAKLDFYEAWRTANEMNPDYQVQRFKVMQEGSRLGYARNQRWPELNLKGSYGLNGLGESPGDSWQDIEQRGFPSWTIGVELRVPLGGGIKTANELAAARMRVRAAELGLREVETQIANALDTAMHKIRSAQAGVQGYQTLVAFNQNLLDSALARLEVGRMESRKVLEIEADLLESRTSLAEALVQFQRARLEFELVQGATLRKRNLEFTQNELSKRTDALLRENGLTDEGYRQFVRGMQEDFERRQPPATIINTPEQIKARQALDEKLSAWPATNVPPAVISTNAPDRLRDALRKAMDELKP